MSQTISQASSTLACSTITAARTAEGRFVCVAGRGTMRQSPAVRDWICRALAEGARSIVVDLSRCEYLDSTFLGLLVGMLRRCASERAQFALVADRPTREKLMGPTRLDTLFQFVESPAPIDEPTEIETEALCGEELGRHVMETHRALADNGGSKSHVFKAVADRLADELGDNNHRETGRPLTHNN